MYNKRKVGALYEQKAGRYLEENGYKVLQYNYRCRQGEIDIIAKDGEYYVFCEVKYRSGTEKGYPSEAVGYTKQKNISRCAFVYLTKETSGDVPCRFDVISITDDDITILKNAFDCIF